MITAFAGLGARVNRRGAALLFFSLLDFIYCITLLLPPEPPTAQYRWMATIAPLWLWGLWWGVTGIICAWYAFRTYDTTAFMAAVALKVGWGLLSLFGWLAGALPLGYLSTVIWLAFAAFVYLIAGGIPSAPARPPRKWRAWTRY